MHTRDRVSLAGKVTLVTAGARGIGHAIAPAFADPGTAVGVADADPEKVASRWGRLDVLLNNAGTGVQL